MGFFDILKSKKATQPQAKQNAVVQAMQSATVNLSGEPLDRLIDGELPFGWAAYNEDLTESIRIEFLYYLNKMKDASKSSPEEHYAAKKAFVDFLHNSRNLCNSKGECFAFWYSECVVNDDYIKQQECELKELEANVSALQNQWETRQN